MRWVAPGGPASLAAGTGIHVERNVLPAWPPSLRAETARLVGEALRVGEATAKSRAPVDTGFLRNNIVVRHRGQDGTLHSRANYSAHVNYGTRYMSARPFFSEGVTRMREHFNSGFKTLHQRMPRI